MQISAIDVLGKAGDVIPARIVCDVPGAVKMAFGTTPEEARLAFEIDPLDYAGVHDFQVMGLATGDG